MTPLDGLGDERHQSGGGKVIYYSPSQSESSAGFGLMVMQLHLVAATMASFSSNQLVGEIRKLGELKKEGLLSYDEFSQLKRRILALES